MKTGKLRDLLQSTSILIGALVLWEVASATHLVKPLLLPSIPDTFSALAEILINGNIQAFGNVYGHLAITIYEICVAFAIGASTGFVVGVILGRSRSLARIFEPLFTAFYAIPMIVFYPIMFLFLGIGSASKIALGTVMAFFPMLVNTLAGVNQIDEEYVLLAQSMGATRSQIASKVIFPAAIGAIVVGLRFCAAGALIGVLVSEMTASQAGLGFLLIYSADLFRIPELYAFIIIAMLITIGVNKAFSIMQKRVSES